MISLAKKALKGLAVLPALALAFGMVGGLLQSPSVLAQGNNCASDPSQFSLGSGADCAKGQDQQTDLFGSNGVITTVTNVLLFLVGAISVIMLIIGGIRYVVSAGDQNAVTGAKNTILYAVIGIIVALLGYAIVNFVISTFSAQ